MRHAPCTCGRRALAPGAPAYRAVMSPNRMPDDIFIDANGCLAERIDLDGMPVVIHYDDVPETDVTVVDGIRCTTPLRTVIDLAPEYTADGLREAIRDCLDRGLFTRFEAFERLSRADMRSRPGALTFAEALRGLRQSG